MGTLPESVVNRLVSVNPRPSCAEAEADRGGGRRLPPLRGGDTRPRTCCSLPLTPPLMLPRTDCRKRSSSIRSLVLFENAMLEIATILPWERRQLRVQGERRAAAGAHCEGTRRNAEGRRKLTGAGERWRLWGRGQLTVIQKCSYTVSPRALTTWRARRRKRKTSNLSPRK